MEYDKVTSSTPLPPAKLDSSTTTELPGRDHLRVKGDGNVDTKLLSQPIKFPFSGRTALNRLLKAPRQNAYATGAMKISCAAVSHYPNSSTSVADRGEGGIGIIVQRNTTVQYDAGLEDPSGCSVHRSIYSFLSSSNPFPYWHIRCGVLVNLAIR